MTGIQPMSAPGGGGGGAPTNATYVTQADETATLPNSERVLTIHGIGSVGGGARPAAAPGNNGWLFAGTDTLILYRSDGATWVAIASLGSLTTPVAIAQGGTGQTTALAAFDALSPLTTEGDLLQFTGAHNARLPIGANGFFLVSNGTDAVYRAIVAGDIPSLAATYQVITAKGAANGYAGLDAASLLAAANSRVRLLNPQTGQGVTASSTTAQTQFAVALANVTLVVGEVWEFEQSGLLIANPAAGTNSLSVSLLFNAATIMALTFNGPTKNATGFGVVIRTRATVLSIGNPGQVNFSCEYLLNTHGGNGIAANLITQAASASGTSLVVNTSAVAAFDLTMANSQSDAAASFTSHQLSVKRWLP